MDREWDPSSPWWQSPEVRKRTLRCSCVCFGLRFSGGYRASEVAARDYGGFPTLLVVTISSRAEASFAHAASLARGRRGGTPLELLLTTTRRIESCPEGILGPIWLRPTQFADDAFDAVRDYWLPGGPPRGLYGVGRGLPSLPAFELAITSGRM
jgi:hypothetical protein